MTKSPYQPKTRQRCSCRRGIERDNCAACEGTGWHIDFAAIRARAERPRGCSKGCTGRMCRDALNCDAPKEQRS